MFQSFQKSLCFRLFNGIVALSALSLFVLPPSMSYAQAASVLNLPAPGVMVGVSPTYVPALIKGMTIHPENPLMFDFIIDTGHSQLAVGQQQDAALRTEAKKLVKYFLASLTIPEDDLWVNLSPYEHDRMIPEAFGQTEMGRDLLAQDYLLKQITASLIYPEEGFGKNFWDKIYAKAKAQYGTTDIPVNTFNKVWVVPDQAGVLEKDNSAFVVKAHLKVMLEEDYLALEKNREGEASNVKRETTDPLHASPTTNDDKSVNTLGSQIVRELVIPELEREVNEGKNFAQLRQVFYSLILAKWFKKNLKESLINQVYADQNKVAGVNVDDTTITQQIYEQYLAAYKKGVFNYIKEDYDGDAQETIPRKYFSGGALMAKFTLEEQVAGDLSPRQIDQAQLALEAVGNDVKVVFAMTPSGEGKNLEAQVADLQKPNPAMTSSPRVQQATVMEEMMKAFEEGTLNSAALKESLSQKGIQYERLSQMTPRQLQGQVLWVYKGGSGSIDIDDLLKGLDPIADVVDRVRFESPQGAITILYVVYSRVDGDTAMVSAPAANNTISAQNFSWELFLKQLNETQDSVNFRSIYSKVGDPNVLLETQGFYLVLGQRDVNIVYDSDGKINLAQLKKEIERVVTAKATGKDFKTSTGWRNIRVTYMNDAAMVAQLNNARLFMPTIRFEKGKPIDTTIIRERILANGRTPEQVIEMMRNYLSTGEMLVMEAYLRGIDGAGSSIDLTKWQELLVKLGIATFDELPSTTVIASAFKSKVRFELASDPDAIEYVAPAYGITEENPYSIIGPVKTEPDGSLLKRQKDAPAYIFRNIFGLKGIRIVMDEMPAIAKAGGMESSNAFNTFLVTAASALSGANLSFADIVALAVFMENYELRGGTGGQGHWSSILGRAYKLRWTSGVKNAAGQLVNNYGVIAEPLLNDAELEDVENNVVLVQTEKTYNDDGSEYFETPLHKRAADLTNDIWTHLMEFEFDKRGREIALRMKELAYQYSDAFIAGDFEKAGKVNDEYVDLREELTIRGMNFIADFGENKPDLPEYVRELGRKVFDPSRGKDYEANKPIRDEFNRVKAEGKIEQFRKTSPYSIGARDIIDEARKEDISMFRLGAGGPGGIFMATSSKGKAHLQDFFRRQGLGDQPITNADAEAKMKPATNPTGEIRTLSGYMEFKVGREPIKISGFDKLVDAQGRAVQVPQLEPLRTISGNEIGLLETSVVVPVKGLTNLLADRWFQTTPTKNIENLLTGHPDGVALIPNVKSYGAYRGKAAIAKVLSSLKPSDTVMYDGDAEGLSTISPLNTSQLEAPNPIVHVIKYLSGKVDVVFYRDAAMLALPLGPQEERPVQLKNTWQLVSDGGVPLFIYRRHSGTSSGIDIETFGDIRESTTLAQEVAVSDAEAIGGVDPDSRQNAFIANGIIIRMKPNGETVFSNRNAQWRQIRITDAAMVAFKDGVSGPLREKLARTEYLAHMKDALKMANEADSLFDSGRMLSKVKQRQAVDAIVGVINDVAQAKGLEIGFIERSGFDLIEPRVSGEIADSFDPEDLDHLKALDFNARRHNLSARYKDYDVLQLTKSKLIAGFDETTTAIGKKYARDLEYDWQEGFYLLAELGPKFKVTKSMLTTVGQMTDAFVQFEDQSLPAHEAQAKYQVLWTYLLAQARQEQLKDFQGATQEIIDYVQEMGNKVADFNEAETSVTVLGLDDKLEEMGFSDPDEAMTAQESWDDEENEKASTGEEPVTVEPKEITDDRGKAGGEEIETPKKDPAQVSSQAPGGIDLTGKSMTIDVDQENGGVQIHFDEAQIERIRQLGVDGFDPVVIQVIPMPSVLPLLGLEPQRREEYAQVSS